MTDTDIETTIRGLIAAGSTYDLDALARFYEPALRIVMVDPTGNVAEFDHAANMAFFRSRAEAGAPHLSQDVRFLHSSSAGDTGMAVVERRMALTGPEPQRIVFTLQLRRQGADWLVIAETAVILG